MDLGCRPEIEAKGRSRHRQLWPPSPAKEYRREELQQRLRRHNPKLTLRPLHPPPLPDSPLRLLRPSSKHRSIRWSQVLSGLRFPGA